MAEVCHDYITLPLGIILNAGKEFDINIIQSL